MKCPACGCIDSKVIDSRLSENGKVTRRRRECTECRKKFTTYERIEETPVLVVKNDGTRQEFDIRKVQNGVIKSCEKRPVTVAQIEALTEEVARRVQAQFEPEVSSKFIGEVVMEELKKLDEVAYVRYASVYRSFKDIHSFMEELQLLMQERQKKD